MYKRRRKSNSLKPKQKMLSTKGKQIKQVSKDKPMLIGPSEQIKPSVPIMPNVHKPYKPMSQEEGKVKHNKYKWTNMCISRNWIVAETNTSHFIEMPIGTRLEGYGFWHPKKYFKDEHGLKLSFHDGFTFKMMKYAEKKDGETGPLPVLDVFMIGPAELIAAFGRLGGELNDQNN